MTNSTPGMIEHQNGMFETLTFLDGLGALSRGSPTEYFELMHKYKDLTRYYSKKQPTTKTMNTIEQPCSKCGEDTIENQLRYEHIQTKQQVIICGGSVRSECSETFDEREYTLLDYCPEKEEWVKYED
tara:strand:+ start:125 stop:508 length:384 start_codon:yes stop_codon:yes gene_type:complete